MKVIISHYQGLLFKFDEQIEEVKGQLSHNSDSNRYGYLLRTLKTFNRKHEKNINFVKSKKLEKLIKQRLTPNISRPNSQSANSTSWIPELCLTTTEQGFILNGEPICDRIIDSAMSLIHQQNPCFFFQ